MAAKNKTKQNKKRSVPHTLSTFLAILRLSFMKLLMEPTENSEKSEPQMGFELTTLRDLFRCSNHSVDSISNFISYIILTFAHLAVIYNQFIAV